MTTASGLAFLNSIVPQKVDMVTLDAVAWNEFKVLAQGALSNPTTDPKFKTAVEQVNQIVDSVLG
jgi:hypothetical protein